MKVKICPKCGSTDIGIPPVGLEIEGSIRDFCRKCLALGNFPLVEKGEIAKFRKKVHK